MADGVRVGLAVVNRNDSAKTAIGTKMVPIANGVINRTVSPLERLLPSASLGCPGALFRQRPEPAGLLSRAAAGYGTAAARCVAIAANGAQIAERHQVSDHLLYSIFAGTQSPGQVRFRLD